jgi:hypothetical protein
VTVLDCTVIPEIATAMIAETMTMTAWWRPRPLRFAKGGLVSPMPGALY